MKRNKYKFHRNVYVVICCIFILLLLGLPLISGSNLVRFCCGQWCIICFALTLADYLKFAMRRQVWERMVRNKEIVPREEITESPMENFDPLLSDAWWIFAKDSEKTLIEEKISWCKDFWYKFYYSMGMTIMAFMAGYLSKKMSEPYEPKGTAQMATAAISVCLAYSSIVMLILRTYTYCYVSHRMKLWYGKDRTGRRNFKPSHPVAQCGNS